MLSDDFAPHKTGNVWNACWSRGYVSLNHGGGTTPVAQTPDTDLNQHVRREYGIKESRLLMEKMQSGQKVPRLTHEECMLLMLEVLSDPELHRAASLGYKKTGESIDLHGKEDGLVCREAGVFWREETTDKFPSMRQKIDAELAEVRDEFESKGIKWCAKDVKRLIMPYPARPKVDRVLEKLGEDFYEDDIHCLDDEADDTAVAEESQEASSSDSDETNEGDTAAEHVLAAVAGEGAEDAESAELEGSRIESAPLDTDRADAVHKVQATMAALEAHIEGLRIVGSVRGVASLQRELNKERRKARALIKESPAVADAFQRLRTAEDMERLTRNRIEDQQRQRKRGADKALADSAAAARQLRETKRKLQEMESISASRHAIKTFTLEALGAGTAGAGGAKARNNRFQVLDRLAGIRAGLSPGQKNDWSWFKEAWDKEMVKQHGADWAALFAKWMQSLLEDEHTNAFSTFMHNESSRVLGGTAALQVPGV